MQEDTTNGDIIRTEIVQMLKQGDNDTAQHIKFIVESKNGEQSIESIVDYVQLCDIIEAQIQTLEDGTDDSLLTFKSILAHQGLFTVKHPNYKGSSGNLLIEWDVGEPTWEP
jgi:hypothetical protein